MNPAVIRCRRGRFQWPVFVSLFLFFTPSVQAQDFHLQRLEGSFQEFYKHFPQTMAQAYQALLQKITANYYVARAEVGHFDLVVAAAGGDAEAIRKIQEHPRAKLLLADLEAYAKDIRNSQVWRGLQDIRSEKDQYTEQARYFYYRLLLEDEQERVSGVGERKAMKALSLIHTHLREVYEKLSVEALPYSEVFSNAAQWVQGWNLERRENGMSVLDIKILFQQLPSMKRVTELESDQGEQAYLQRHKDKIEMLKSSHKGAKGFISQPLHKEGSSGSYFKPSTGREGNIVGSRFPNDHWVLTYDDGPAATTTGEIMDLLEAKQVPAVFFWLRRNTKLYPSLVSRAIDLHRSQGVELANHSYTHFNLAKAGPERLDYEVTQSSEEHTQQFYNLGLPQSEPALTFFRLPYGSGVNTQNIRQKIVDNSLIHVFWNVDSLDWQDKKPSSVLARVKKQMQQRGGGVILFHDIHSSTVDATELLFADKIFSEMQWLNLTEMVAKVPADSDPESGFQPDYEKDYYIYVDGSLNVREKEGSNKVCGSLRKNQRVRLVEGSQAQGGKALIAVDKVLSPDHSALRNCQEPVVSAHYLRLYPKP